MKIRRFRVSPENIRGQEAVIDDPKEMKHLRSVLRLGVGDRVILFDGEGKEYPASIARLSRDKVFLSLLPEMTPVAADPSLRIILGMALLRPSKFEWLLQKATELGVSEVIPFHSLRVVPRWEEGQAKTRQTRWEKIVSEASKQCGRAKIPKIHFPCSFEELLAAEFGEATKIFLWEREKAGTLGNALAKATSVIFALIGPEGGFSEQEALQAQEAGFHPVRLGPRILRAETAAVAIVALLQFILGDMNR